MEQRHSKTKVRPHQLDDPTTYEHPATLASGSKQDKASLKAFIKNMEIEVISLSDEEIVFDLAGVEPPLANALRRILISEIPTMAIEKLNLYQNTSILPDENLAHRLGLIPINADPRQFEYREADADYSEDNTIKFRLKARCTKKDPNAPSILNSAHDEDALFENSNIYSKHLKWVPVGDQKEKFGSIRPIYEDILIAKLRPGQELEMEMYCEKGTGKTHAKWSPVSTAYYRLVPDI